MYAERQIQQEKELEIKMQMLNTDVTMCDKKLDECVLILEHKLV